MSSENAYLISITVIMISINIACLVYWRWNKGKEKKWPEVERIFYSKRKIRKKILILNLDFSLMIIGLVILIFAFYYPEVIFLKHILTVITKVLFAIYALSAVTLFAIYAIYQIWEWTNRKRKGISQ